MSKEVLTKKQLLVFPPGFLWGSATSAYQTEGNNWHSDWWKWERARPGRQICSQACNHYRFFKKDFDMADKILHNNAHRFSLEWARLEPRPGVFSKKETAHYSEVLRTLKKLGMTTFVTLQHFTLPDWLANMGGFSRRANLHYFERYAEYCADKFGGWVDFWITINEPNALVFFSNIIATFPPEQKSFHLAVKTALNLAAAHARAYKIIHRKIDSARVGLCANLIAYKPRSGTLLNKALCKLMQIFGNEFFYWSTPGSHDFIGANYYFKQTVSLRDLRHGVEPEQIKAKITGERGVFPSCYPKGIFEILTRLAKRYRLPIYVTENGIAGENEATRNKFISDHLSWTHKAIKAGADVRGYFYWSLLDNFEWNYGFEPRFGLFRVDYRTFKRTPRGSAFFFGKICRTNALSPI